MPRIKRIPCPYLDGEYVRIYQPYGDTYNGIGTEHFKSGEYYDEWITNDFSIIKDGDTFHMVGITHPKVPGFVDAFDYS